MASPFLSVPTSPKRKWSSTERCRYKYRVSQKNALSDNHFCQYSSFTRVSMEERHLPSSDTLVTGILAKALVWKCVFLGHPLDFLTKPKNLVTRDCMCRTRRRVGEGWFTRAASWTTGACTTSGHKVKRLPGHNGPKAWVLSAKKVILGHIFIRWSKFSFRISATFQLWNLGQTSVQNRNPLFSQQCNGAFQHCPS